MQKGKYLAVMSVMLLVIMLLLVLLVVFPPFPNPSDFSHSADVVD